MTHTVNLQAGDDLVFGPADGPATVTYDVVPSGATVPRIRDAIAHRNDVIQTLHSRVGALEHQLERAEDTAEQLRAALSDACGELGIDNLNHWWRRLAHDYEGAG
jgi:hypothetical protein